MKSTIYFCIVIFFSTTASFYITQKEITSKHKFEQNVQNNNDLRVLKNKTKNLLSKFVQVQEETRINIIEAKENLEKIKQQNPHKTLKQKKHEFYYQHNNRYIVQGNN